MEKWAYVTGQEWTDNPGNCCPTIGAFLRRHTDTVDQQGRDAVDAWLFENAERVAATAEDGDRQARAFLAADWAVRTALPVSLRVAGMPRAAECLQGSPEITDARSALEAGELVSDVRDQLPNWWEWRSQLRAEVHAALPSAGPGEAAIEEVVAGVTLATLDATVSLSSVDGAACAAALGDLTAAATIDAVAAAAADGAAAAALDMAARHAVTLATEEPLSDAWARWTGIYRAVNPPVRQWLTSLYGRHWEPAPGGSFQRSSLRLLDRMVWVGTEAH